MLAGGVDHAVLARLHARMLYVLAVRPEGRAAPVLRGRAAVNPVRLMECIVMRRWLERFEFVG